MVEGAEAWCKAKLGLGPLLGAGAGGAAAVVALLLDAVCALSASALPALVGGGLGSKGGRSIMLPAGGEMRFTVWGVINCRF
jgi:hypothetical protein